MNWQEIRLHHPNRWLLAKATRAHTGADQRILDDLIVVGTYDDSSIAMRDYTRLHWQRPDMEFYVLHSSREMIKIEERRWVGI